jgi:hypothetical protein
MTGTRDFATLVILVMGYALWSIAFVALYAGHGLSCEADAIDRAALGVSLPTWIIGSIWLFLIIGTSVFAAWVERTYQVPTDEPPRSFIHAVTLAIAASASLATLWIGLPVLLVSPCL